jgi:hypothetical protein
MIDALIKFGAIVGLATGAFTVWDRLLRWRPIAYIIATNPGSTYIRIKNIGQVAVIVWHIQAYPSTFKIATDHSVHAIVSGVIDRLPPSVVNPQRERDFLFFMHPTPPDDSPKQRVLFVIHWRKASSTWLPQIPIFLFTTTVDIRNMAKG